MNNRRRFTSGRLVRWLVVICVNLVAGCLLLPVATAQLQGGWSPLIQLSSGQGAASEATLVVDRYDMVHAIWVEALDDDRDLIQYARYDGKNWSVPNDIYVTREFLSVKNVSAAIDPNDRLTIIWSEGDVGPVYFSSAPVTETMSASNWEDPYRVNVPAGFVQMQIDANNVFHLLFSQISGNERGVYYIRSEDLGVNWTVPYRLDPDIPADGLPTNLEFVMDVQGGLHASWYYFSIVNLGAGADWVRYANSLDGGRSWSKPFTIDKLDAAEKEEGAELSAADPILTVQGDTVHIIWAGGILHYRHHRYSADRGLNWSPDTRILGELNGQAGEGFAVDNAGRVHFFGQIRFPQGIYHAVWEQSHWSQPELVYLIRYSSDDDPGDNIGAHNTRPIIRGGNQLILTFADEPSFPKRRLFVTETTINDLPATTPVPTPTLTPVPAAIVESTPVPPATQAPISFDSSLSSPTPAPRADFAVWYGIVPIGILLLAFVAVRLVLRTRR